MNNIKLVQILIKIQDGLIILPSMKILLNSMMMKYRIWIKAMMKMMIRKRKMKINYKRNHRIKNIHRKILNLRAITLISVNKNSINTPVLLQDYTSIRLRNLYLLAEEVMIKLFCGVQKKLNLFLPPKSNNRLLIAFNLILMGNYLQQAHQMER